jgi:glutamate-5-semialdehyde dehydrogenase
MKGDIEMISGSGTSQIVDSEPGLGDDPQALVAALGRRARAGFGALAAAPDAQVNAALAAMADRLVTAEEQILSANVQDVSAAAAGTSDALRDRLRLDAERLRGMAEQLRLLAEAPFAVRDTALRDLPDGLRLFERRRPIGVVGATFEARPNVTIDVASQLIKSRNAGVLRTGSAALKTALELHRRVIVPALLDAGLDPSAIQLIPDPRRETATALVRQPGLIPLVILRGSGETTRSLAEEAARNGVRTLAHADGGGVLYLDAGADPAMATRLLIAGVDRLGVCNRVNLVLVHQELAHSVPGLVRTLEERRIRASLAPHRHPLGQEWAQESGQEATVTIAVVPDASEAVTIANTQTSGLAATIVTDDAAAADRFLTAYIGTGAFWNASTRLLDGFKLHGIPETGINVDHVPGPRGPVTYHDLHLRQYVVTPAG